MQGIREERAFGERAARSIALACMTAVSIGCGTFLVGSSEEGPAATSPASADASAEGSSSPTCAQTGTCPPVPAGFDIVTLHKAPFEAATGPQPCTEPNAKEEHWLSGPIHDQAACSDCSCAVSADCETVLHCTENSLCESGGLSYLVFPLNGCTKRLPTQLAANNCNVTVAPPQNPCKSNAKGGEATLLPPWTERVTACVIEGTPDSTSECVRAKSSTPGACPAGFPNEVKLYPEAFEDKRACAPCACSVLAAAPPMRCGGTPAAVAIFEGEMCNGLSAEISSSDNCTSVSLPISANNFGVKLTAVSTVLDNPGACIASGGTPADNVHRGEPTSVCCAH